MNTNLFKKAGSRSTAIPQPDTDPNVQKLAELRTQIKGLESELEPVRLAVTEHARDIWLAHNRNSPDPRSSVQFGDAFRVTFSAQWSNPEVLPEELRVKRIGFKLDSEPVEDQAGLVSALRKLAVDYPGLKVSVGLDVSDVKKSDGLDTRLLAMQAKFPGLGIEVKEAWAPVEDFDVRRHRDLTPKQNVDLERAGLGTKVTIK